MLSSGHEVFDIRGTDDEGMEDDTLFREERHQTCEAVYSAPTHQAGDNGVTRARMAAAFSD